MLSMKILLTLYALGEIISAIKSSKKSSEDGDNFMIAVGTVFVILFTYLAIKIWF